ncbi:MAG: NAD-dependent dehydratase [Gallionellales bacterium RBG_16_57_15]|nr:MAG: NAD-dependent dehydratase [Gallionellales bacterium RBG_16_57_15]
MRFLVTGANGFVGKALCAELLRQDHSVRAALRSASTPVEDVEVAVTGAIDGETDWTDVLRGVDVVIHLAARVHVMKDKAADPLAEFLKVNLHGTANLAQQAARAGVKRFVYVSSIKVNGEGTANANSTLSLSPSPIEGEGKSVFSESDSPRPHDPYGISKWQAEQALQRIALETGLGVVIVRPPLVYGPGVKGNFAQMLKVLGAGIPLPLASVHNLRSLVYVENLVDALIVCATHRAAAGQIYLVSDGEDVSTPGLLRLLGDAMGHPVRLFPCPPVLLKLAGRLTGKAEQVERLLGSLRVDSGRIRRELDWTPPRTLQQGLQATVEWYRDA